MSFKLGCAIWSYKEWVGSLFPAGSRAADFLHLYSRRFTIVEGNTTFYSIPDAETVKRWAAETPPGFEFCPKLPRDLTHRGSLAAAIPATIAFVERMRGLGDRLGPLFAQLPPNYSPAEFDDLIEFLKAFPHTSATLTLEVRHPDWFHPPHADRLNHTLADLGIGRVLLDTRPIYDCADDPQLHSERRKPKLPLQPIVTANVSLIRYISHPTLEINQTYLHEWVGHIDQWLHQGTRIYFFVHCPVEKQSPANARYFQQCLEQAGVSVPSLPWTTIAHPPAQLSLF